MSIKNILVAHTGSSGFESSVRYSAKIAAKHGAWLTAVYGGTSSYFDQVLGLTDDLHERLMSVRNEKIVQSVQLFDKLTAEAGIADRAHFISPAQVGNSSLPEIARSFDFVVTGYQPKLPNDEFRSVSPDLVALQSGRPVLVVPDQYVSESLADHALVAWDGKRSSARALNDAMSVLEEKPRKVSVLTAGDVLSELPEGIGIETHLERHGIQAEHLTRSRSGRSIAEVIQATAAEVGAKLIVMGAYEHSKFSQDLFGGVTHEVIRSTKVPVFMSH